MTAALEGGEWSAALHGRTLLPRKTRYPFYRRLGGPQGRSGRAENLVPTGIRSRSVQSVVSRCTDWATWPTVKGKYKQLMLRWGNWICIACRVRVTRHCEYDVFILFTPQVTASMWDDHQVVLNFRKKKRILARCFSFTDIKYEISVSCWVFRVVE